ncbi:MAG TPA: Rne/Rng family ribonuclease [Phycisphaerae bacterium]|nr:Rne/Rng family ribonuclease [Phycisphaerae bacterium]
MVQQSEKAEGNALGTETKKSPKKRTAPKRKKKSTSTAAASKTTARRQRVKRKGPASQSASDAASPPPEEPATIVVKDEAKSATAPQAEAKANPDSAVAEKSDKPASSPRTLKRPKPRKPSAVSSESGIDGIARKNTARRKKPVSRTTGESGPVPDAPVAASVDTAASPSNRNAVPIQKTKEPFGAGIVRSSPPAAATAPGTGSGTQTSSGQQVTAKAPSSDSDSSAARTAPAASVEGGDNKPGKPKGRRSRGGKAKRKKTTAAAEAPKTDAPKTETRDANASEIAPAVAPETSAQVPATAGLAEHAGETEEERKARIVLKRRPVRRARRSKSRLKAEAAGDAKSPAATTSGTPNAGPTNPAPATAKAETPTATPKNEIAQTAKDGTTEGASGSEDLPRKSTSTRNRRRRRGQGKSAKKPETEVVVEPLIDDDDDAALVEISDDIAVITDDSPKEKVQSQGREMIINSTAGAECRIAILHAGRLEEIYIERQSSASHVGNIYKGKITNVESSIQAAFVDFGLAKNGFLHISDVLPKYFPNKADATEDVGKKVPRRDRPPIQKCFRRGDEVIVQVAKEGVGTKGPTLTTYLSIPGRFVVMMPGMSKLGVSRRIEDDADRKAMRDLLGQLSMPDGMGFILRTAGLNRNKRELQSDLNYLNRLWKTVQKRIKSQATPCELYQESDLVIRTIRDVYSSDFNRIVVDDPKVAMKAKDFLRIAMPRTQGAVVAYQRHEPIFHHYGIEQEIQRIYSRHVPLPSGGSIVIDSTEAMVAIDVNSGKYRDQNDAEETAYRINIEAAEEIARQLRLRDLGGLVVCDFIDMRQDRHKRAVEKALRDALKSHKERARILRMSKFGLIEMTRQRQGPSIKRSVFVDCRHCSGSGLVKTAESMSLEVLRILQLLIHRNDVAQVAVSVAPDVCALVLNQQRAFLHHLESKTNKTISILPDPTFTNDQVSYKCVDDRGMPLRIEV